MNNFMILALYTPFAVITAGIFIIDLLKQYKRQEDFQFTLLCFCAVCWFASNIVGVLAPNAALAEFMTSFILIFVGFIPPLLLLFVLNFYRVSFRFSNRYLALLFVVPAINTVMALTANYHSLIHSRLEIVSLSPRIVDLDWGPWFWVHTVHSYVVAVIIISVILSRHFKIARFYRMPSTMMVIGISITLAGNLVTLLQLFPIVMDPTLITISLSLIFFDLAIINNNNSRFVRFSRGQLLNYLSEFILVLDENNRIVDCNQSAREWFAARRINLISSPFQDVLDALLRDGEMVENMYEGISRHDLHLNNGIFPLILNLRTQTITDVRGDEIGSMAVLTDVTENRKMIDQLEAKAGIDSLTGLPNHMAYTGAKRRLDNPDFLPLSVIVCDANNLKTINDTMGHQYGDMLLQVIAEILDGVRPQDGFVARIGGDEFVYLLENTSYEEACDLMDRVRSVMTAYRKAPFSVSASFGAATKSEEGEDLGDVVALADSRMYEDKKRTKEQMALTAEEGGTDQGG